MSRDRIANVLRRARKVFQTGRGTPMRRNYGVVVERGSDTWGSINQGACCAIGAASIGLRAAPDARHSVALRDTLGLSQVEMNGIQMGFDDGLILDLHLTEFCAEYRTAYRAGYLLGTWARRYWTPWTEAWIDKNEGINTQC